MLRLTYESPQKSAQKLSKTLKSKMSRERPRFLEFGAFRVDLAKRQLLCGGDAVPLTVKVFDTLLALLESNGEVIEKDDLMKKVWPDSFVEEGNLTQNISVLRKVLGESPGAHEYIATVPRRGYRFVAEVKQISDERAGRSSDTQPAIVEQRATPVLAVLPFKLFVSDSDDEYLGIGMADALITRLSNVRQVIVRPTSAVLKYAGTTQDPAAIGRELRVESVLEGSIRKSGGRMRATVQLVSVEDERSLWAAKFDEKFTDIFAVEDSIAERVAGALELRLSGEERLLLTKRYTETVEAHEFYLKGRYHANKFTLESFYKAIECFDRALDLDPDYAMAYAGIAEAHWIAADLYLNPKDALQKTKEASGKAIAIDDTLAEAHTFMAGAKYSLDWDWVGLEREFKRAIELNPGFAPAHQWYGWCLGTMGRHDEAIAESERAKQLDPFSLNINWFLSAAYDIARRYTEAIEIARNLIELEPNFWGGHWALGRACSDKGDFPEAIAAFQKASELDTSPWIKTSLAEAYALRGEKDKARSILDELKALEKKSYVSSFFMALVHLALGENDEAFGYLEKAFEMRDSGLPLIKVYKPLDRVRSDPRLMDLMLRIGL
jgi:DNA-binding winged helix-turn-helix (wHTH) protein/tetratricopeptide (TPR) repeat protein